jgi:hypothetical protein
MRTFMLAVLASALVTQVISGQSFAAVETGFEKGNTLTARDYQGQVTVHCNAPGDQQTYFYSCHGNGLEPVEFSKFVIDPAHLAGMDANQVALSATWENGHIVYKDMGFDSKSGKSKREFNLWINTLLQRALLNYGTNKIHYVLSKDDRTQAEGDFIATVQKGSDSTCEPMFLYETLSSSCQNAYEMCQRYFSQNTHCQ